MKKIIVPIIITMALLIGNSVIAQTTSSTDTLKVEKKEKEKAKIRVKVKTGNVVGVHAVEPADPQQKITVNEDGVKTDKGKKGSKKEQSITTDTTSVKTKPIKGEEKKGTEVNELKKGGN